MSGQWRISAAVAPHVDLVQLELLVQLLPRTQLDSIYRVHAAVRKDRRGSLSLSVLLGGGCFGLGWEMTDLSRCAVIKSLKQALSTGESSAQRDERGRETVRVALELLLFGSRKDLVSSWLVC